MSRWGPDDERGALNLIDRAAVLRGLGTVKEGIVLQLAIPVDRHAPSILARPPVQHFMTRDGGDYASGQPEHMGFGFADDCIAMATHATTHLDALAHVWQGGLMYNDIPATEVTSQGAARCGIDKTGPLVTRGIFVDLVPDGEIGLEGGHAIGPERLLDAVQRAGVMVQPGDALLVRTGWLSRWRKGLVDTRSWPGLHPDCAGWIVETGIALVGADNIAVEVGPSAVSDCAAPLHIELMCHNGVYLAELLDLEPLAEYEATTFLLAIAPLRIVGGVGSPITPVAVL